VFDPDLMKLVLMNLISNAMTRSVGGLHHLISGGEEPCSNEYLRQRNGMTEEVRKSLFNPFFTTKEKGLGLGLFIVYNIVQAMVDT
jgi:two-component system sensor histidine kinase FlrB